MVLSTLISHPELLNRNTLYELRSIVARYPYFQTARLLMLNNLYLLHDPEFGSELRRSVLYVNDRRTLCRLIEGYTDRVMSEESEQILDEPTIDRTMSLIDAFLGTLPEEDASPLPLIPDTTVDYAMRFLSSDEKPEASSLDKSIAPSPDVPHDDSVGRALELMAHSAPTPTVEPSYAPNKDIPTDEELLEESYFTETLAKIYIKQHKYSRALEIIRSLYLQFPEKNTYFADQIRFLEKLIINNNLK